MGTMPADVSEAMRSPVSNITYRSFHDCSDSTSLALGMLTKKQVRWKLPRD